VNLFISDFNVSDRRFIRAFFAGFFGLILFFGMVNLLVDPYGFHFNNRYTGFNRHKPSFLNYTRIVKLYNANHIQPEGIFLGNSRILYLAPEEAFSRYRPLSFYNFSLSSGTPNEMKDLLDYAIRNYNIRFVCYGIDFIAMINWSTPYASTFDTLLVRGEKSMNLEFLKMHTSAQSVYETGRCIYTNITDPEGIRVQYHYNEFGSRTNRWRELNYERMGDNWVRDEIAKVMETYKPIYNAYSVRIPGYKEKAYRDILQTCHDKGIEYVAFTNPLYEDQFRLLLSSRAYPVYTEYLRFLAENGGFWYFGGINEITSDMGYYWDSQHPRKKLSFILTDIMLNKDTKEYRDKFFGHYYHSGNIDTLITGLDSLRTVLTEGQVSEDNK